MKTTAIDSAVLVGPAGPTVPDTFMNAGSVVEGAHALAVPIGPAYSTVAPTENGPSDQKSQYQYPMWPNL